MNDLVVCFATEGEAATLPATVAGRSLRALVTGVGPVNAACALARLLAAEGAREVVCCGVGGAYPGAGLDVGDVACAETEFYGDLGVETADGFLDMEALRFPVVAGEPPLYNRLPLDLFPTACRVAFVTLSTCTGTDARAAELAARTGGAVESMEGAAVVHTARLFETPVGEVRGISNPVGERDRARWRVGEAAAAARAALLAWIEERGAC